MTTANATLLEQFAQLSPEKRALIMAKLKAQGVDLAANEPSQPASLPPIDRTQPIPLSFPQEQLWFLQQFQPESVAYNERIALRLEGPLDVKALDAALQWVVQRHESLRTTFTLSPASAPDPAVSGSADLDVEAASHAMQVIHPFVPHTYAIMQQSLDAADDTDALARWADAITRQPFDLTRGPLWRLALCAVGVDAYVLLLVVHHIIADAWSIAIFLQEVAAAYTAFCQGKSPQWPAPPVTYADFAGWQHQQLQGATLAHHLAFWQQSLQGAPLLLQLPTDFPRPPVPSGRGSVQHFSLGQELTQQLKALSRQAGATIYITLLSALNVLLYRYTGQDDIVIGSVQANRAYPELEGLIGHFVNTLALRTRLPSQATFRQLLQQVREQMQASYEHQALPFQHIVQAIQPTRSLGHHPIYQVSFNLHNQWGLDSLSFPGLRVQLLPLANQTSKLDLYLLMYEAEGQLHGVFEYNCDLFAPATIARMVGHFQTLLTGIVAGSPLGADQRLSDLPLLTEAEQRQLLVDWNDTATDYPQDKCIHQLFEEQVERTPDAMAVIMAGGNEMVRLRDGEIGQGDAQSPHLLISQSLTYAELNARANQLAHHLQSLGVGRLLGAETLVGICMDRSIEMVVSILAIFKAGGAYVPLDSNYPTERLAFMIQDAQLPIILTQYDLREKLTSLVSGESQPILISLDRDWQQIALSVTTNHDKNQGDATNVHATVTTDNLAYVIYTSGSTGKPKGVMVEHGSLTNLTCAAIERFHFHANSRVIQYASLSFDASLLEIACPLCSGGQLYLPTPTQMIPGPDLAAFLQSARITYFQMPPAVLHILPKVDYPDLEVLMTIGDACTSDEIAFWSKQRYFCNGYGPTECTIGSISAEVMNRDHVPPIGRPFRNVQAYVLDHNRQPVPIGVPGELYLGGVQVARGYFKRPQLTAEKFVALDDLPIDLNLSSKEIDSVSPRIPLLRDKRRNLYKTGDLVRYLPNGDLDFIGRIDQMVKLRGIRIELGEIEAVLRQHPAVQEAVVIAREDRAGEKHLVAYVVPNKGTEWQASSLSLPKDDKDRVAEEITLSPPHPLTWSALRSHLQTKLPDYMLPSAFVVLDALPLTPNGKVDRKALPAPDLSALSSKQNFVPPTTPTECIIADIWSAVLGVEPIGIHDNFFELGGHSLLATQVISRIRERLHIEIPLRSLFENPTIEGLTQRVRIVDTIYRMVPIHSTHKMVNTNKVEEEW